MRSAGMFISAVLVVLAMTAVRATVVAPKSFEALVLEADIIFRGEVVTVTPRRIENGPRIETVVSFRVDRALKGNPGQQVILHFLGGTVGDTTYSVSGVPQWVVGDRGVFFARLGLYVSPIVGFWQGRFPIQRDRASGLDIVMASNGRPFSSVKALESQVPPASPVPAMRLVDFERDILQRLSGSR